MTAKRIVLVIVVIAGILVVFLGAFRWGQRNTQKAVVTDYASCIKAGYAVTGKSPRKCKTPDGKTYTEKIAPSNNNGKGNSDNTPMLKTREFTSPKGVAIKLYDWAEKPVLSSPVTIKGEVPGNWSFEASFPVVLTDWDGKIIAQGPAKLEGDWMTDAYVPFSVTLTFETSTTYKNGSLILKKDNPSDLLQNDDAIEIPITYK